MQTIVCQAHAKGVRLVAEVLQPIPLTGDKAVRSAWIQKNIDRVKNLHYDGVNFDWEYPCLIDAPERNWYTGA
jgi:hypothetical protein